MFKVFVDGMQGTTGLKINHYLSKRSDIELLQIDPDSKKSIEARHTLINKADILFLCLPDDAARESVSLLENPNTRIIDASTAHRTDTAWTYGLPELNAAQRSLIKTGKRLAVPGCHATGFILITRALVESSLLSSEFRASCTSLTGYSGGGKKMIEEYKDPNRPLWFVQPRPYALTQSHKHIPEMNLFSGLKLPPVFVPIVCDVEQGMAVSVPFHKDDFTKLVDVETVHKCYADYYKHEPFIRVMPLGGEKSDPGNGFLNISLCNDSNRVDLFVFGNNERIIVTARYDNLGKGASGAAIQCMNIMMDVDESETLTGGRSIST